MRSKRNPYTLLFGKKPLNYLLRASQINDIVEDFRQDNSTSMIYMIAGVRGCGKTVTMTGICNMLEADEDWIVLELNPEKDMLWGLASRLYEHEKLRTLFLEARLNLSAFGIGIDIEGSSPVFNIEVALERMLSVVKKRGKRVLVAIDEITNNEYARVWAASFQILIRKDLPVYMLATGLYENIYNLQNEKTLTFLYRAPKVFLEPLNHTAIRANYMKEFETDKDKADRMAYMTKGYAFAFQVIGYLYYQHGGVGEPEEIIPEYDAYLADYVYEKIWSEMSKQDREVLLALAELKEAKIQALREKLGMTSEKFSVYRDRLKRKGVIDTSEYGKLSFILPRFEEFILDRS